MSDAPRETVQYQFVKTYDSDTPSDYLAGAGRGFILYYFLIFCFNFYFNLFILVQKLLLQVLI